MDTKDKIQLFEDKRLRAAWNEENEEWLFSVVDVVGVLTDEISKAWPGMTTRGSFRGLSSRS
jgi:hypothetical protein